MKLPPTSEVTVAVLFFGLLIIGYALAARLLAKWRLPMLVGGIAVGLATRELLEFLPALATEQNIGLLEFLGTVGIVCLLFRVGLEADIVSLRQQFKGAAFLWVTNVAVSGFAGFAAARWWLDYDALTSLVLAVALSATSVAIPVEVWRSKGKLKTPQGQRFLEVAELDDISAVLLMALLFSILPSLSDTNDGGLWLIVGGTLVGFVFKLSLFFAVCWTFAKFVEKPLADFFQSTHPIIIITGIGFVISAFAGMLGFSVAVGAFFAGLAFSRDPRSVGIDAQFGSLHEFFTPFFFISIGFQVPAHLLGDGLAAGSVLLFVAIAGKLVGSVFPARLSSGWRDSFAFGVSMVPRAEIALLVVATATTFVSHQLPEDVFPAMILVALVTSVGVPFVLDRLLDEPKPERVG